MRIFYFLALLTISSWGIVWAMRERGRFFQYPALISAAMLGYILPQAWPIAAESRNIAVYVPDEAYYPAMLYSAICVLLAYAGYSYYQPRTIGHRVLYNPERLFRSGLILLVIGTIGSVSLNLYVGGLFGFYSKHGAYFIENRGVPVYLAFLARYTILGLSVCLIATLLRPNVWRYALFCIGLLYPLVGVIFLGRRHSFIILLALLFVPLFVFRKIRPPRIVLLAAVFVGFLAVVLFPAYRANLAYDADHKLLAEVNPVETVRSYLSGASGSYGTYEDTLALGFLGIGVFNSLDQFQFGGGVWNWIVQQYVPRTVFGSEVKESLKLNPGLWESRVTETFGYRVPFYYIIPGINTSFFDFGYFGAFGFFFLGRLFRMLYVKTTRDGDMRSALLYVSIFLLPVELIVGDWGWIATDIVRIALPIMLIDHFCRGENSCSVQAILNRRVER